MSNHALAVFVADEEDSTKQKISLSPEFYSFFEWNRVVNRNVFLAAEANLVANEKVFVGLHGEYFIGDLIKRVVFPNFYFLDKYMYGVNAGYHFQLNDRFDITPQFKYSFSYMRWTEREEERYYLDDHYFEIRPEIILNYKIVNAIYIRAGAGYTMVGGLQLSGIEVEEINGMTFSAGFGLRLIKP